jgi:L-lactate dehydrogenase complex protein LldG
MSERNAFLQRVRQATAAGNRAGAAPALPSRGGVGYQGAGADLMQRFCAELTAAGGQAHVVADAVSATARVVELVQAKAAKRVLLGLGPVIDLLLLPDRLRQRGLEVAIVDALAPGTERDTFFQADVGVSGVLHAVAETGTLVMASRPQDPRSLSLLPPVHIAVVDRCQLLADLFDLFADLELDKTNLPACLSLITGPSKTGDIELRLVTGVHGPGELLVVVLDETGSGPAGAPPTKA